MNSSLGTGWSHKKHEKGKGINFREVQGYGCRSFKTWYLTVMSPLAYLCCKSPQLSETFRKWSAFADVSCESEVFVEEA